MNMIIAIDGFSSTGKSTIAKLIAKKLNIVHVDSGAMYRAITYFALQNGLISNGEVNTPALVPLLSTIKLKFGGNSKNQMMLNDENIESQIRTLEVSNWVSEIAKIAEIRTFLVAQQQKMAEKQALVMDGRDIGTVVFPAANVKLFFTCSPEVRAQRRYDEMQEKGNDVSYKQVLENIIKRDKIDTTRKISPLKKADDAIEINTDNKDREEVMKEALNHIKPFLKKL